MGKEKWFENGLSSYFTTSLLTQSAGEPEKSETIFFLPLAVIMLVLSL